ncbi:mycofactocin biosynthesis peptidyl-dipeptidase MftE [Nocardioides KLBMP 9356]|uniref:Mycofactocin biosynthesis peptidyl-dipeptidase MftE n=1 Tax=Nocardioides potassii TaxID=2911371 RepID=A0ABS9HCU7_9ACTN|nr:mycofactocin biosynthesis peptidyl-dipeptidase MftE [Nocardioides potassii]MCF6378132.1 mycofactocin biosynthesis peptidyl-dipeptidase MftE [Nocardioides potassii]
MRADPALVRTGTEPRWLANATWPSVDRSATVLVPVGSTEQHGPHLPLDTDTTIATAVASAAQRWLQHERGARAFVAPPVSYGSSGEHQAFAGTCSIGTEALVVVLVELVRSLRTWAGPVVLVNGHGGNLEALRRASTTLRSQGQAVAVYCCSTTDGDLHAGHTETSLMLYLAPEAVRVGSVEPGNTEDLEELMPRLRKDGVASVSPNGVLGDPRDASAAHGRRVMRHMTSRMAAVLDRELARP